MGIKITDPKPNNSFYEGIGGLGVGRTYSRAQQGDDGEERADYETQQSV